MHANPRTIFNVFDGKRRYVIPIFQRQYVWSREKQWEPLWKDIVAKAEEILIHADAAPVHFLGAIVTSQVRTFGDQVPAFEVIDGQQRLTTFQIFLSALRAAASDLGQPGLAGELEQYMYNGGMMEGPHERFKVWPSQPDIATFKDVMTAGSPVKLEETYRPVYKRKKLQPRPAMVEAYLYFHGAVREFAEEEPERIKERVRSLYDAIKDRLQLVSIELEDRDDPQVIFETLNARGEPLLASDLLRNFVFLRAARAKEGSAEALYDRYWSAFDKELDDPVSTTGVLFWKKEERQGRLTRARLDLFMQHFLSLKTEHEINIGRLYQEYRTWILTAKPYDSVSAELDDLTLHAGAFRGFFAPNLETRLGLFSARLRTLDTATVYPFLLALVTDPRVPKAEIDGILTDLESFLIRRMICERTIKNYNRLFLKLFRDITREDTLVDGKVTRAAFQSALLAQVGDTGDWPDDAVFKKAWLATPLYDRLRPALIEMVLRGLERALSTKKGEKITIHGRLTIEHVMPQTWETYWPLPPATAATPPGSEAPEDLRERLLHTIGNLTLLTQELNTAVRNAAYASKQPEITAQSALRLNAYFQKVPAWDEAAILVRGEALFELAKVVWPHPGGPAKS